MNIQSAQPLVSIIIPAYNRDHYIAETLDSCLNQTYPNTEIIVIDDGSQDDTVAIVRAYGTRIRLIEQRNQGPAIARNRGIEVANGDYIQFCDSDDLLHPDKITRCMALLQQNPDLALVFTQVQAIDATGKLLDERPLFPAEAYFTSDDFFCQILYHIGSPLQTSSLLLRKAMLSAVGAYRADPDHRCAEDWDLLLRLADRYPFAGIAEPLTYYRYHTDALTQDARLMAEGRLRTAQYARDYARRSRCLSDDAYAAFEAGRHHALAMMCWRLGQRDIAREHLAQAIDLTPQGRLMRRLMLLATRFISAQRFESLLASVQRTDAHARNVGSL